MSNLKRGALGCRTLRVVLLAGLACLPLSEIPTSAADRHEDKLESTNLHFSVSWLGNSFSGANNKWVQNFFIHTKVQPDGTVNTWSHWDEGGKKFGVYKAGDVIGNTNISPNSLETQDKAGHTWKIAFDYVEPKFHEYDFKPKGITCDGESVRFHDLFEPMALALANDGQLMIADSQTSPRQQVLYYNITDPKQHSCDGTRPVIQAPIIPRVASEKLR